MAIGIIDMLKLIDIDKKDSHRHPASAHPGQTTARPQREGPSIDPIQKGVSPPSTTLRPLGPRQDNGAATANPQQFCYHFRKFSLIILEINSATETVGQPHGITAPSQASPKDLGTCLLFLDQPGQLRSSPCPTDQCRNPPN